MQKELNVFPQLNFILYFHTKVAYWNDGILMFLGSEFNYNSSFAKYQKSVRSSDNIVVHSMVSNKILGVFSNPMRHKPMVFHVKLTTVGSVTLKTSLQSTALKNALSPNLKGVI
jgi:hypothetical protein